MPNREGSMDEISRDRVIPLDQLDDYEVAEGDPDVRGWEVIASDGRRIGEVDELLIDTQAMKVRYLDVDLSNDVLVGAGTEDRHVLIPIGYARLEADDSRVRIENLASDQISSLPPYEHAGVSRDYETDLRQRFDQSATNIPAGDDFYAHEGFDENRFYGNRASGSTPERMNPPLDETGGIGEEGRGGMR
jgi:sporulation protein YlmC with PRC-barrel domain